MRTDAPLPEDKLRERATTPNLTIGREYAIVPRALLTEAADALASISAELDALTSGEGFVYLNPDTGTEYSPNHPVESGECEDATDVRRSTFTEDTLNAELQTEFTRAESLRAERDAAVAIMAEFYRLSLVIESAVRTADPEYQGVVLTLIRRARAIAGEQKNDA